jgi:hypothetical protein
LSSPFTGSVDPSRSLLTTIFGCGFGDIGFAVGTCLGAIAQASGLFQSNVLIVLFLHISG